MNFNTNINADKSIEVVHTKFKSEFKYQEQHSAMLQLNDVVKQLNGFNSRTFYFSEELGSWVDFVIWENEQDAKEAAATIMQNPTALEVFSMINEEETIFSHYGLKGGIEK
mgnify:CR=1 FL=1